MGGGILQLVAYGAQDIYITGKPEMTFFKYVFKRHTNFAIECITQTFSGSADFGKKLSCTLSRNGDLISRAFLKFKIGALSGGTTFTRWCNGAGYALVSDVTLNIGGQEIDKHYGKIKQSGEVESAISNISIVKGDEEDGDEGEDLQQ